MPEENQEIKIIFGSRSSRLAKKQVDLAAEALQQKVGPYLREIRQFSTLGDQNTEVWLRDLGGKGVFCREIDRACLAGEIDVAVHSAKDMAADIPVGLEIVAVLERGDPRDVLVSKKPWTLSSLPKGAHLGTSSLRRQLLINFLRPDLKISNLRGNVQTRMTKVLAGQYDATLLAAAGLQRLGYADDLGVPLGVDQFIPAPGQGAIALLMRREHPLFEVVQQCNHAETKILLETERAFLKGIEGSCLMPIGAYAQKMGDHIVLAGMYGEQASTRLVFDQQEGVDPREIGQTLAEKLKSKF